MLRYAAYGSNLHPLRLRGRTPSARLLGTGTIRDSTLRFHKLGMDGSGKCDLVPGTGNVHVAVYELARLEQPLLDRAEGPGYRLKPMDVAGFGACFVYAARASHIDESLAPYTWYRELVITGCEYLGFPPHYVKSIAAVDSALDPDAERHSKHMELIREARAMATTSNAAPARQTRSGGADLAVTGHRP